jgi:hypothetical protein
MASQFEVVAGKSIGYTAGLGGAVTQITNKSTGVVLNKPCGAITMHNASLTGDAEVTFTVTNSEVAATDVVMVSVKSGATTGKYLPFVTATTDGTFDITVSNVGATAGEAVVLNFAVIKAAAA